MTEPLPYWKVATERRPDGTVLSKVMVEAEDQKQAHERATAALGVTDTIILEGVLLELINVARIGSAGPDDARLNYMLVQIQGIAPRDQIESMLAVQMAVTHSAMLQAAAALQTAKAPVQLDSAERRFNKLARTFTAQVEALKRYRSGGQQKVIVEHVHVHSGGQAIVGNVSPGVGEKQKPEAQPHATLPRHLRHESGSPLPCHLEAERAPLQVTGGAG